MAGRVWAIVGILVSAATGLRVGTSLPLAAVKERPVEECAPDTMELALPHPQRWQRGDPLSFLLQREQLATAYRALSARGLSAASGLGNHLTMSVGPDGDQFLLNRYGLHWMEVTAENLLLIDLNGEIIEGEGLAQGAAIALHAPIHRALGEKARVIFHTHQPWFTALACIENGGLHMFHPDACIYDGHVGVDPVYTGNWPAGSLGGSMMEGERLLQVPELKGRTMCFLGNHGSLQISSSVQDALFDCLNVERLCKAQVHAMQSQHYREFGRSRVLDLKSRYEKVRQQLVLNHYNHQIVKDRTTHPIVGAWSGIGDFPELDSFAALTSTPVAFMSHALPQHEWQQRCDVAAACRLISRLNGHNSYEGAFAHFSVTLCTQDDERRLYLTTPADVPFGAMRASLLVVCDENGEVVSGTGYVDQELFRAFCAIRDAGDTPYGAVLFTHTEFTDRLAQHEHRVKMITQSAFNFAGGFVGYYEAWGHGIAEACDAAFTGADDAYQQNLVEFVSENDKVFVMLSHGGCIARGEDAAHVFSLVHGIDAAAEIQVYAEMTGAPLIEIPLSEVVKFPRHGYGDMRHKSKRMAQNFDANKRLLLCNFNQGFRDTGDAAFIL